VPLQNTAPCYKNHSFAEHATRTGGAEWAGESSQQQLSLRHARRAPIVPDTVHGDEVTTHDRQPRDKLTDRDTSMIEIVIDMVHVASPSGGTP
jgi:hypothetical protein